MLITENTHQAKHSELDSVLTHTFLFHLSIKRGSLVHWKAECKCVFARVFCVAECLCVCVCVWVCVCVCFCVCCWWWFVCVCVCCFVLCMMSLASTMPFYCECRC